MLGWAGESGETRLRKREIDTGQGPKREFVKSIGRIVVLYFSTGVDFTIARVAS
jgi:hypothetical protein